MSHADTLDQQPKLAGSFWGSVMFHASVAGLVIAFNAIHPHHDQMGDVHGGGMGAVEVSVVAHIPLPARNTPPNPVANPTESAVPTPPPKVKPQPKVRAPEPEAIPIKTKREPIVRKPPREEVPPPNKFREQQKDVPNQVYSKVGQAVSSPMYQMPGAGGIALGNNSPLGVQFGPYAKLIMDQVSRNWRTSDIDARIQKAPLVVVTFTINRDGSVPSRSVRVTQSSGIQLLDLSAQRAVLDAAPFPSLPQQFTRNDADIELRFELRR